MNLTVNRKIFKAHDTLGELLVDGMFECWTLEDRVRPIGAPKVPGQTAISAGRYRLKFTYSPKFKTIWPEIMNVPGFTGVRIHSGTTDADTEGCLIVAQHLASDVDHDRASNDNYHAAYNTLLPKLTAAVNRNEEIWIDIINQGDLYVEPTD